MSFSFSPLVFSLRSSPSSSYTPYSPPIQILDNPKFIFYESDRTSSIQNFNLPYHNENESDETSSSSPENLSPPDREFISLKFDESTANDMFLVTRELEVFSLDI
eukprot:TRINITY_DN14148_c0_g1_i1.p1 TRINITY_DN14148_c0_g1~~TRINITY_DN14148_c0_g1_i1.p1  ORF type:complete len:105 (+),score=30.59 TRINITY_DN14148_c0_g1_i1:31-345(+)